MKRLVIILAMHIFCIQADYNKPSIGSPDESVEQAKQRFAAMSARQINNIDIHTLSQNQLEGFRAYATSIFHSDIASSGCYSKARVIKYEIMYQKIGEIDQPHIL